MADLIFISLYLVWRKPVVWTISVWDNENQLYLITDNASVQMQQLDERVVGMYKSIRQILQRYRSGKLPKAFKIIPALQNWEQVKYIIALRTFDKNLPY